MLAVHGVVGRPSAPRSVEFRTEIGPVPHRDRSGSASRSVQAGDTPAHLKLGEHYATQGDLLGTAVMQPPTRVATSAAVRSPEGPELSAPARAGAIIAGSVIIRARRSQVVG